MTAPIKHEPIALPDVTRLNAIPPLPAWLVTRQSKVSFEFELGSYRRGPTLPQALLLGASERVAAQSHVEALHALIAATPENDGRARRALLASVTKMMLALPSQKASEDAGEAKAEAFDMSLKDVPYWAINEAISGWYQGRYGDAHNYTWQPAPAVLRSLAFLELAKIRYRIQDLENLLKAKAQRELPPESERPTLAQIEGKLRGLKRVPDAPVPRQDNGYAKRALADLEANKLRRKLGVAPSACEAGATSIFEMELWS